MLDRGKLPITSEVVRAKGLREVGPWFLTVLSQALGEVTGGQAMLSEA